MAVVKPNRPEVILRAHVFTAELVADERGLQFFQLGRVLHETGEDFIIAAQGVEHQRLEAVHVVVGAGGTDHAPAWEGEL